MNGRERFVRALGRGVPDRVPVFLRDLTLGLDESGYSTPEVCAGLYDAKKAAASVIALNRRLHQDAVVGCIHFVGLEVEMLGGEVRYPERGIPSVIRHPYQDTDDPLFEALEMKRDGPFPNVLRCYREVSKKLGQGTAVVCNLEGPVTKAALLRGMENLALDMHFDPDLATSYVEYATDLGRDYLHVVSESADLDCAFIAAASDNPDIFGQDMFRKYTLPNLSVLRKEANGCGIPTVFHPHGDLSSPANLPLMDEIASTGVEGFQFAERNDPLVLKERYSDRMCLLGGIDAFSTLLLGPVERIEQESLSFLRAFEPCEGYVFMCSCSLHRGMPLDNVDALMRCLHPS
jgi:MtaA/CmuA family methyltransferase